MQTNNNSNVHMGCGDLFLVLLQIVFIVLKLCGVIAWHWALVLLPIIIIAGIWVLFILIKVIAILFSKS